MAEQLRGDQVTGIAAQFTLTKARPDLWERLWTARAMSSLPVPVSPVIKNGGVSRGDSGNPGKNGLQGLRGPDNLLENSRPQNQSLENR